MNVSLEPVQLLDLRSKGGGRCLTGDTSRASIPHEQICGRSGSSSRGEYKLLLIDLLAVVGLQIIIIEILVFQSIFDEHHNVGSIGNGVPTYHSLIHLILDEIHYIHLEITVMFFIFSVVLSKSHQVDKRCTNGIIITSAWSNVLSEDAYKLVIQSNVYFQR